jgi:hypothetical protein
VDTRLIGIAFLRGFYRRILDELISPRPPTQGLDDFIVAFCTVTHRLTSNSLRWLNAWGAQLRVEHIASRAICCVTIDLGVALRYVNLNAVHVTVLVSDSFASRKLN